MITTAGKVNKSEYFYIIGDSGHATPGEPVTGLLFSDIETGGSASYCRQGSALVNLTLITLDSSAAAHSDGGFIEVSASSMPGVYRCDYPDAAYVTGVDQVICQIVIASSNNAIAAPIQVDITNVNLRDSTDAGLSILGTLDTKLDAIAGYLDTEITSIIAALTTVDGVVDAILDDTSNAGVVLSAAQMNMVADHFWRRTAANIRASADGDAVAFRSGLGMMAKLVNAIGVVSTDLLIREEDDSTTFGTQAITTNASAEPIVSLDTT